MRDVAGQRERVNQKRRTRAALVQAARELLEQGRTPTIADVADEALVSRATAYRYFPSQEHLLLDVVLERSIDEIDRAVAAAAGSADAAARIEGLVSAIQEEIAANIRFRSCSSRSAVRFGRADGGEHRRSAGFNGSGDARADRVERSIWTRSAG